MTASPVAEVELVSIFHATSVGTTRVPTRESPRYIVMRRLLQLLVIVTALGGAARGARAQGYPFSQRGKVTQHVAHTTIAIEYGRPVAR